MKSFGIAPGEFSFQLKGREYFWRTIEEWIPTDVGIEVSCGRDAEINIESKSGVSESQITALKSFSATTLGIPNIVSLKAGLEASSSHQVTWSEEDKVTIKIPIPAPPCGAQLIQAYRIKRTFHIRTVKQRLFREPLFIDLPQICDLTKIYKAKIVDDHNDERCPCKQEDGGSAYTPISLHFGNLELAMEAIDYGHGLYFNLGKERYEVPDKRALVEGAAGMLRNVPPLFRFLAGLAEEETEVKAGIRLAGVTIRILERAQEAEPVGEQVGQSDFA